MTYTLWCEECGERVADYQGETGRNGYTRGKEQLDNIEAKNEDKSVLRVKKGKQVVGKKIKYFFGQDQTY